MDTTDPQSLAKAIVELEREMRAAAKRLEFEQAAALRDHIKELRSQQILPSSGDPGAFDPGALVGWSVGECEPVSGQVHDDPG